MSIYNWKWDDKLIEKIHQALSAGKVSHAYIIEGDTCVDKMAFAKEFFKAVVCSEKPGEGCDSCLACKKIDHDNYENLYYIHSDGLSVKDEAVLYLQENLKMKPTFGNRNLAVIQDADTMTLRAQNRLLKTLEEPSPGTVILLLSENRENLLETIRSRCIIYRLSGANTDLDEGMFKGASQIIDGLLGGSSFFRMKEMLSKIVKNREDAMVLLDAMERIYRDFLLGNDSRGKEIKKQDIFKNVELIEEARRDLILKVNYNYAIRNLIIKIGG